MTRSKFTSKFKTKVVLEALKERHSSAELAQKNEIHPTQISAWKRDFLDGAQQVFERFREGYNSRPPSSGQSEQSRPVQVSHLWV